MLPAVRRFADGLIGLSAALGALGLLFEVVVVLVDVTGRYFGLPLRGAQDLSQMTMVALVFGAMALCDRLGGHIAVDIFEARFPRWLNRFADVASALIGVLIFAGIAWAVFESAKISQMLNLSTNILRLPKVYFQWALCGFAVITALGMLLRAIELTFSGVDVREEVL